MSSSNAKPLDDKMPPFGDCPVCYDAFTAQVRKAVQCPYCEFAACVQCNKRYLSESMLDAHCMGCHRAWNDEFLDLNFTRAFRMGPWKKHREDILIDREMALLPTRQPRVEARHKMNEISSEKQGVKEQLTKVQEEITILLRKRDGIQGVMNRLDRQYTRYDHEFRGLTPPAWTMVDGDAKHKQERAQFIMKCPDEECRGFLSTAYKCGTCQKYSCKDCLEVLGKDKPEEGEHTCNEERKASVTLIIKESKPCPKCGTRISKIDGCDQMWCIDCHTAFSWNTGQQVTGVIHNPHYYQYLRQNNGGVAPRNAGDVPCGGLPTYYELSTRLRNLGHTKQTQMTRIHRIVAEIQDQRLARFQGQFNENDNGDLGTMYLMKEVSKDVMKAILAKREVKRNKEMAIRAVLEMFVTTSTMMLGAIANGNNLTERTFEDYIREFTALRTYTNENLRRVGQIKHCSVPQIGETGKDEWYWIPFHKYVPLGGTRTRKPKAGSNAAGGGDDDGTTVTTEYDEEEDEVV
jgi:hypothetical protein